MSNLPQRKYSQIKDKKPVTCVKPKVIAKSSSVHNSSRISVKLKQSVLYSARRTNPKPQQEGIKKEEANSNNNIFKEKQHTDMLRKSLHQKDQIILSKSLRIKQLEIEMTSLKGQLERYRTKTRQMALALESNKKNTCEMAQALLNIYLNKNRNEDNEHNHQPYPDPDTMTYEELLELEEKIGYVSKGLSQEAINAIPLIEYKENQEFENKCLICQYEYEEGDSLRKINCKHLFHRDCLDKWLKDEKICPNCKREV